MTVQFYKRFWVEEAEWGSSPGIMEDILSSWKWNDFFVELVSDSYVFDLEHSYEDIPCTGDVSEIQNKEFIYKNNGIVAEGDDILWEGISEPFRYLVTYMKSWDDSNLIACLIDLGETKTDSTFTLEWENGAVFTFGGD